MLVTELGPWGRSRGWQEVMPEEADTLQLKLLFTFSSPCLPKKEHELNKCELLMGIHGVVC